MVAEVHTLYEANFRNIPAMLRRLADRIEAGEYPGAKAAVLALEVAGPELTVFGWGDTDGFHTLGMLEAAKFHVLNVCNR